MLAPLSCVIAESIRGQSFLVQTAGAQMALIDAAQDEIMRKVSDSADISMLKIATDLLEPKAAFSAMLTASVVLPMEGRPAMDDQIAGLHAGSHFIELFESGRDTGHLAVGVIQLVDPVDRRPEGCS